MECGSSIEGTAEGALDEAATAFSSRSGGVLAFLGLLTFTTA
jgi:hypothetical protein